MAREQSARFRPVDWFLKTGLLLALAGACAMPLQAQTPPRVIAIVLDSSGGAAASDPAWVARAAPLNG
jgi:hypothetical protein